MASARAPRCAADDRDPARSRPDRADRAPHVVKSAGVLSGEPPVDGTRLAVRHVLRLHRDLGKSAEAVAEEYGLTLAQVHDALSYAYDHPDEMAYHEERHKLRNIMREQDVVYVAGRLIDRQRLKPSDVPPGAVVYTWETLPKELDE